MIDFVERAPWSSPDVLLLIGPGGVGKSTLARELAPLLHRPLVDLDLEFGRRVGDITTFIQREGYEQYKRANSELAAALVLEAIGPIVLATSSGFLSPDNPSAVYETNRSLLATCYSVCLLPSRDLEETVRIVVRRQLTRPFARERRVEELAIRRRYSVYLEMGDLVVFSAAPPREIAWALVHHFSAVTSR